MHERPSKYLVDKCKTLQNAILFFLLGDTEKKITFLAQIDFWDWEMDELIYAVQSFSERAQAWIAGRSGVDALLRTKGIIVKTHKTYAIYGRDWKSKYRNAVKAPIKELNYVITKWHELLGACENSLLAHVPEQFGVHAMKDLGKYKKQELNPDEYPKKVEEEGEEEYE